MKLKLVGLVVAIVLAVYGNSSVFAQGSFFSSLSGTVVDSSGLVIPGATVRVKNKGTGAEVELVTGGDGGFNVQAIPGGTYEVTVTLEGFKTKILESVTVNAAIPATVKVALEVGVLSESVTVVGESATVVHATTPAISTNISGDQIVHLALTSRNALDSLTSLAGFNTSGTARNSTVSGLPKSAINITLDGMSVQDNYLKTTDGYFARLSPLLDSVEEVTVTTAANTADATGQGAVQIRFVTKSGTNQWRGTAYEYLRHDALNANSWFRNRDLPPDPKTGKAPKDKLRNYTQGAAQGGPIIQNKAFFFFNYEENRVPSSSTLQRVVLTPSAASGIFSYNAGGSVQQVNLLALAAANGQLATVDPTVSKVLADITAATQKTGGLTALNNPLVQQYTWSTPTKNFNPSPTVRIDYQLSENHRLTGSMNYRHVNSTPDTTNSAQLPFPGFATTGSQQSTRWTTSESLRSTFGQNLVNEFRVGGSGGATLFSPELEPTMWQSQAGYRLNINGACCGTGAQLTNPGLNSGQSSREASTKVIENTLNWSRGSHSVTLGGLMVQADVWLQNQTLVPTANFGLLTTEPADAIFNATTLPGASAADITQAKNLYAMLTGRITSLTGDARINPAGDAYAPLGRSRAEGRMREFDFFAADSWRATPSLTISGGVRYVLALPFYPLNNSYTTVTEQSLYGISGVGNLFKPGTLTGAKPGFVQYPQGGYAYNVDRNNFGPSLGVAWQAPGSGNAIGRWILGEAEGDSVFRAGGAMAFQRPGMSDFTGTFGANQGIQVSLLRDSTNTPLPILLRNTPALPSAPSVSYPIVPTATTNSVNAFDSNLQMPYTQSYSVGWQRKLTRDSALEVRYVGSRHRQDWSTLNLNEPSITSNGFVDEFRRAQANLQANIAAGRGNTFAYTGAAGTVPLPIFLAHFNGQNTSRASASDASVYTGTNWTSAAFLGFLAAQNPNPHGFMCNNAAGCTTATLANGLIGNNTFRNNAAAAGLPANFFVANPDMLNGANLTTNSGGTKAHSVQVEFRKRYSEGLAFNTSYTWSDAKILARYGFTRPLEYIDQAGQVGNVQHALKGNVTWEIPFGHNRRFGSSVPGLVDRIAGGWAFDGVARIQTGEQLNFGNVRLVGMSVKDLQKAIKVQQGANGQIFTLPNDILDNTVKAFAVSATSATGYGALGPPSGRYIAPANSPTCIESAPGYGDCGLRSVVVNGPKLFRFDLGVSKEFKIRGDVTFHFRAEMLNALNTPYFNPASTGGIPLGMSTTFLNPGGPVAGAGTPTNNAVAGTSVDSFRLTSLLGDNQSRIVLLVWRVRW
ncbi:MAG: carboxypeptidase regulatory-like domain-containing protein [Vicinamibacterales bacterium]